MSICFIRFIVSTVIYSRKRFVFSNVPDWIQHMQQNRVLDDDNIFLKLQVTA